MNITEIQTYKGSSVYLEGIIHSITTDILIGTRSLKGALKQFFDIDCKTYWIGQLESQPEDYAVRMVICDKNMKVFRVFLFQWIGGDKGFDWVMENNEDLVDLLSDYDGYYLYLAI